MLYAVIGKRHIWFFYAPDKTEGKKRANIILFFEGIGYNMKLGGFSQNQGYWEAKPVKLNSETKGLLIETTDKNKIVEIKRKTPQTIDAIYLTRMQKERWPSQGSPQENTK